MNENNQNLAVMNDDTGAELIASITDSVPLIYSSFKPTSPEEKATMFNIMNGDCKRLGDMVNIPLAIKDVFVEVVDMLDKNTGEVIKAPRIILIDKDNVGYACVSKGVFGSLKKLMMPDMFGQPTWEPAINIIPQRIQKGADRSILTLSIGDI